VSLLLDHDIPFVESALHLASFLVLIRRFVLRKEFGVEGAVLLLYFEFFKLLLLGFHLLIDGLLPLEVPRVCIY